uniref:Uncharacterized protein n=1 Tax=Grammatophora oceanica TaxID=210454 RepID=A0A7S1UWD9_9STRA|mmetsp:Transcript_2693/g.3683  ORF Transcript_2693/g.3683 Transcript_2693/m.3683 type:complete len:114 (+) Transcript_2693:151-492(+)
MTAAPKKSVASHHGPPRTLRQESESSRKMKSRQREELKIAPKQELTRTDETSFFFQYEKEVRSFAIYNLRQKRIFVVEWQLVELQSQEILIRLYSKNNDFIPFSGGNSVLDRY